ncbi:MAG: hypothetical protein QOK37_3224 [Thermoanaerobaculia bacterium]|jgi:hypothetical protein|nr:hypothetical protein [Thermoanaerobaculia bacterium]
MRKKNGIGFQVITIVIFGLLFASRGYGTSQAPDILEYGGKTYSVHTNPLSGYLETHPNLLPKPEVVSSGLWRGYIATWSLGKDHLFLKDVRVPTAAYMDSGVSEEKQFKSVMKNLFGETGPRVATWFTGHLIVPTGTLVKYVHMGYGSTYSSYLVATVVSGAVREARNLNQNEFETFRRSQFESFKATPAYARAKAEVKRDDKAMADSMVDDFLFGYYSEEFLSRIFEPAPH